MAAKTQEQIYAPRPDTGFSPRLIIVDLTRNKTETVYVKADVARKYLGGPDWQPKSSGRRPPLTRTPCPAEIR